jgi:uncharacterized protein (DUF2141 family)
VTKPCIALALAAFLLIAAAAPAGPLTADVGVRLSGLRNIKGVVQFCLTDQGERFLLCKNDPKAIRQTVQAAQIGTGRFHLGNVRPGTYALLVFHDENANGKLDMIFGMPREGFAFSANPAIKMRAPRWNEVRVTIAPGIDTQTLRLKYIL